MPGNYESHRKVVNSLVLHNRKSVNIDTSVKIRQYKKAKIKNKITFDSTYR